MDNVVSVVAVVAVAELVRELKEGCLECATRRLLRGCKGAGNGRPPSRVDEPGWYMSTSSMVLGDVAPSVATIAADSFKR